MASIDTPRASYDDAVGLSESMKGVYRQSWMAAGSAGNTANPILLLGGIESHVDWFAPLAARLNARGVSCFAYDRKGWGRSAGKRGLVASPETVWRELGQEIRRIHDLTERPVHVVGQSWSGMMMMARGRESFPHVAELTLIAPGIFPRRVIKPSMLARTAFRTFVGDETPQSLPLKTSDLSESPDVLRFVEEDALRVTAVPSKTLWTTLRLIQKARALGWARARDRAPRVSSCILTRNDRIIDSDKTASLMGALDIPVRWAPPVGHCIALGDPEWTAECLTRPGDRA